MKWGVVSTGLQRVASIGLGVLTTLLLTNVMGVEQFGYYTYVIGIVTLVLIPAQIGIPQFVLRETIRSIEAKNDVATASVIRWGYVVVTIAACIAIAGLIVFSHVAMAPGMAHLVLLALPLVVLTSWNEVRASVLRAYGWVTRSQLPENIVKPMALLFAVAAMALLAGTDSIAAEEAILANVFGVTLALFVGFWLFRKVHAGGKFVAVYHHKAWMLATTALGLTTALRAVSLNLGVVLLGSFGMIEETGLFKVASLVASQVGVAMQVANIVIAKDVGAALERGDKRHAERLLQTSSLLTTLASAGLVLFLLIFGRWLLDLAFPPAFQVVYWPMIILAIGQLVANFTGSVSLLLNLARLEWVAMRALLYSTIVNVIANLALIPLYGVMGAAIASLLTVIVWTSVMNLQLRRLLEMQVSFLAAVTGMFVRRRNGNL